MWIIFGANRLVFLCGFLENTFIGCKKDKLLEDVEKNRK